MPDIRSLDTSSTPEVVLARAIGTLQTEVRSLRALVLSRAQKGDTGWIAPTFQNSWEDYGDIWETAAYRRLGGIVYIRGLVKLGTMAQAAFTLPVGFRPDSNKHMATVAGGAFGYARVMSDGRVVPDTGSNSWFSLANISFPADG